MPKILINGLEHYYEQTGEGQPLIFIHGAFADACIWDPQWQHFASHYRLLRYDLRGHGRTGASSLDRYSMMTFADDLASLLHGLDISAPILCGLSWGGSIAQAFAVRYPGRPKGLVLASSSVAIDLTLKDKVLCKFLVPKWLMLLAIRTLSVDKFTRFSLWLGRLVFGKHFLSRDEETQVYLERCMLSMESREYQKIWEAMYAFHVFPLEKITCPTLVLNGELEPRNSLRHSQEILRRVKLADAKLIPDTHHAMNREEPKAFNDLLEEFLHRCA
jgi:pimeloyl-ACP methyl ester carboxylesterase